jgi:hypothetical protein
MPNLPFSPQRICLPLDYAIVAADRFARSVRFPGGVRPGSFSLATRLQQE